MILRALCRRHRFIAIAFASAAAATAPAQAQMGTPHVDVSADLTWDDNVTRASRDERLSDTFARLNIGAGVPVGLTQHSRLLLDATVSGELYDRYSGLNRTFLNFNGELQYRGSGQYSAPTYGLYIRQAVDWYNSDLRDGYRAGAGVSIRKPVTDRIHLFGAAGYNWRNANSTVFHGREWTLRGDLDYTLAQRHTLYLGLEYKDGDTVTTSTPEPALVAIRVASVPDDVFTNPQRNSYRLKSRTGIATLGYNFAVKERQALDLSYRFAYSRPKDQPPDTITTQSIFYVDHQIVLSYLVRF
jgi:opacity protein-like surface antigen